MERHTTIIVKYPRHSVCILGHSLGARFSNVGLGTGICTPECLAEGIIKDVVEVLVALFFILVAELLGHWGSDGVAAIEDKIGIVDLVTHPFEDLGYIGGIFEVVPLDEGGTFRCGCWGRKYGCEEDRCECEEMKEGVG